MPEPTSSEPTIIVREPDLPRIAAATRAILGELARPRPDGQWATDYLAPALASRADNTPYEDMELPAVVTATLLRGRITARDGKAATS